jgi:DNA-binding transcriptional LysR family regulator
MSVKLRFRHIEGFRAVMQTGTATGAASLLNVTQPAVSALMAEMESVVGFSLFDRRGGRLVATTNAGLLFDEIERCFTGLEHVNAFCTRLQRSQCHAIVIAAVPSMALSLLPIGIGRHLREVAQDFFTVLPRHSNETIRLVGSQKADIGFGSKPVELPGIHCEPISTYELICALPAEHALAGRDVIHAKDIESQPFISISRDEGVYERIEACFLQEAVTPATVAECTLTTGVCALVENGARRRDAFRRAEHRAAPFPAGDRCVLLRVLAEGKRADLPAPELYRHPQGGGRQAQRPHGQHPAVTALFPVRLDVRRGITRSRP